MPASKIYDTITAREPLAGGWSKDEKYCATMYGGTKYLLRISSIERLAMYEDLFAILERLSSLGVPMCKPVEYGICQEGFYTLFSWIDGEDLRTVLPGLSEKEQYRLGVRAGEILRIIHSIPAPENQENWAERVNRKIDDKTKRYQECGIKIDGDEHFFEYTEQNRHLLEGRPQCFQHDDYHAGNMMLADGELTIIDFDRSDYGDPWEEFKSITWNAQLSPCFATGQINGYFGGNPPLAFFKLLAFYVANGVLAFILGAIPGGQTEIDVGLNLASDILRWYDNMSNPVPTWYLDGYELK